MRNTSPSSTPITVWPYRKGSSAISSKMTGWDTQPPVQLNVRNVDGTYHQRAEQEWPLARTQWTRLFLDITHRSLRTDPPVPAGLASFEATGDGLTFVTDAFTESVEITGPAAAKLEVDPRMTESSDSSDRPAKPQDYAGLRAELATLVNDFSPLINELWPRLEDHKYRWDCIATGCRRDTTS